MSCRLQGTITFPAGVMTQVPALTTMELSQEPKMVEEVSDPSVSHRWCLWPLSKAVHKIRSIHFPSCSLDKVLRCLAQQCHISASSPCCRSGTSICCTHSALMAPALNIPPTHSQWYHCLCPELCWHPDVPIRSLMELKQDAIHLPSG
jgi:hypothetical protein